MKTTCSICSKNLTKFGCPDMWLHFRDNIIGELRLPKSKVINSEENMMEVLVNLVLKANKFGYKVDIKL